MKDLQYIVLESYNKIELINQVNAYILTSDMVPCGGISIGEGAGNNRRIYAQAMISRKLLQNQ